MASDWPRVVISDVCELIVDCVNKTAPVVKGPTPFKMIRTPNVKNGVVNTDTCRFVESDTFKKWTRRADVEVGDVLLTREAPLGEVGIVTSEEKLFLGQRLMQYRAKAEVLDSKFLLYSFLSQDLQHQFSMHEGSGSVVSHIRVGDCLKFELNLPPLDEQRRISQALGDIDKKIQLNRQTNETLEKMAQALFKSWFVDFDPVIDNALEAGNTIPDELQDRAERRQQQLAKPDHQPLPNNIRQLFPSEFELTEAFGWVPMGWEVSFVGNVIENVGGGTPKTKEDAYWIDGSHAFCTPKDMSNMTSKILLNTDRRLTEAGVLKISSGILPVGTVLMSSRAPIGYLAISDIPVSINQGIIALKQNETYSSEYLLCWAESNMEEVVSRANGSTFLEISKKNFRDIPFLEAAGGVLPAFTKIAHIYFERITGLQRQVGELTILRDTLLPKLISGELRLSSEALSDAEQQLADATS
jgi:type I restriction enzyme S subunit